ncbi:hypothetical protein JB92DRAFT_2935482, partial [Gautieria morchelliformis]
MDYPTEFRNSSTIATSRGMTGTSMHRPLFSRYGAHALALSSCQFRRICFVTSASQSGRTWQTRPSLRF